MVTIALIVGALFLSLGVAAWYWMQRPLYRPGALRDVVRAGGPKAASEAAEWEWASEPGIRLHHWAVGAGRAVLVIHGGPGLPFREPLAGLADAQARFRFHYYDQRGCGRSTRPFSPDPARGFYSNMKALERALGLGSQLADIERIRLWLGEERIILVGHSFGALLAALYAAEWPERVAGLVLSAPADLLVLPAPGGDLLSRVQGLLPVARRAEYAAFLSEYMDFRRLFQRTEAETAALNLRFASFYGEAAGLGGLDAKSSAAADAGGFMVQAQYLSMGRRHDYRAALRVVTAPALVVHGAKDLQPEAASRRYVAALPNARLVTIEGAGHFAFAEQPARFGAVVTPFLEGLR